jgi:hypothetical protein
MTNSSRKSKKEKWYGNQAVVLTLLGAGATIIAAVITILPQILEATQKPDPTQTAIPITATMEITPTLPPTSTETAIPFTETVSPTPTETATPTPVSPPISCLERWQIISSDPDLSITSGAGDCPVASVPELGISASRNGISIGVNNFREQGTFGITTPLPADANVTLDVSLTVLTQGEFWIGLSNTPNLENNLYILAIQPKSGELRTYIDQTSTFSEKYRYKDVTSNTSYAAGPPFIYRIILDTSGNKVSPQIHFTNLPSQIVNLPKYLFIGYSNKSTLGSMSLQVEVSDLTVEME